MSGYSGPLPSPAFKQEVARFVDAPLTAEVSGEITTTVHLTLGSPRFPGRIVDPYFSVGASGKDDSNDLNLELDVLINGVSCFGTKPKIEHVSGEGSTNKTTVEAGDTGVTQAAMGSSNSYSPGDVITGVLTITRTASPTTEMANACVVVPLRPA